MNEFLAALWFFLPAGLANASPVFAAKLPGLRHIDAPMDFGKRWRGQPLFGANKTWRGLIAGILIATFTIALQKYLFTRTGWARELSWFDYTTSTIWLLGPLFGAGTLMADAVESAFKRRRKIPPGHPWFPFDQTDYIIGGILFSLPIVQLTISQYLWIAVTWFGLHLLTVFVGYHLGVREKPL